MSTLLHLTTPAEWAGGRVEPGPDGFVHLSRPEQLHIPVRDFYAGRRDLLVLAVDDALLTSEVRVEGGFPHLYGPLLADAVFDAAAFDPGTIAAPIHPDEEPARSLLAAMERELVEMYGGCGVVERASIWRPVGSFLVVFEEGEPVACGGFRPLPELGDDIAEIKRMYVVPHARSRGVARRLLTAVEDAARRAGYARVALDTGAKQPHAEALYRSAGYVEVAPFNDLPAVFWGEKRLT